MAHSVVQINDKSVVQINDKSRVASVTNDLSLICTTECAITSTPMKGFCFPQKQNGKKLQSQTHLMIFQSFYPRFCSNPVKKISITHPLFEFELEKYKYQCKSSLNCQLKSNLSKDTERTQKVYLTRNSTWAKSS